MRISYIENSRLETENSMPSIGPLGGVGQTLRGGAVGADWI